MITYYRIHPETKVETRVARFRLRANGTVEVLVDDARDADKFDQIVVDGRNGRPKALRPEDGQLFLDGLLELNRTRTYARIADE